MNMLYGMKCAWEKSCAKGTTNWNYVFKKEIYDVHYTDSIGRYTPPAGNGRVTDIFRHAREAPVLSK